MNLATTPTSADSSRNLCEELRNCYCQNTIVVLARLVGMMGGSRRLLLVPTYYANCHQLLNNRCTD